MQGLEKLANGFKLKKDSARLGKQGPVDPNEEFPITVGLASGHKRVQEGMGGLFKIVESLHKRPSSSKLKPEEKKE